MALNGGPVDPVFAPPPTGSRKCQQNANIGAGFSGGVREKERMVMICYSAWTATNVADEWDLGTGIPSSISPRMCIPIASCIRSFSFFPGFSGRDTAGKVRRVCGIIHSGLFDDDEELFEGHTTSDMPVKIINIDVSQPEHTPQCSRL